MFTHAGGPSERWALAEMLTLKGLEDTGGEDVSEKVLPLAIPAHGETTRAEKQQTSETLGFKEPNPHCIRMQAGRD